MLMNKDMFRLLFWYLLERLINIPTGCLIGIHSKLILKVTRALRNSKQADADQTAKEPFVGQMRFWDGF